MTSLSKMFARNVEHLDEKKLPRFVSSLGESRAVSLLRLLLMRFSKEGKKFIVDFDANEHASVEVLRSEFGLADPSIQGNRESVDRTVTEFDCFPCKAFFTVHVAGSEPVKKACCPSCGREIYFDGHWWSEEA